MPKGWKLTSLYEEPRGSGNWHVHFAHYTGRQRHGGHEYDKVAQGTVSVDTLRRVLRRYLTLGPGSKER